MEEIFIRWESAGELTTTSSSNWVPQGALESTFIPKPTLNYGTVNRSKLWQKINDIVKKQSFSSCSIMHFSRLHAQRSKTLQMVPQTPKGYNHCKIFSCLPKACCAMETMHTHTHSRLWQTIHLSFSLVRGWAWANYKHRISFVCLYFSFAVLLT